LSGSMTCAKSLTGSVSSGRAGSVAGGWLLVAGDWRLVAGGWLLDGQAVPLTPSDAMIAKHVITDERRTTNDQRRTTNDQ